MGIANPWSGTKLPSSSVIQVVVVSLYGAVRLQPRRSLYINPPSTPKTPYTWRNATSPDIRLRFQERREAGGELSGYKCRGTLFGRRSLVALPKRKRGTSGSIRIAYHQTSNNFIKMEVGMTIACNSSPSITSQNTILKT